MDKEEKTPEELFEYCRELYMNEFRKQNGLLIHKNFYWILSGNVYEKLKININDGYMQKPQLDKLFGINIIIEFCTEDKIKLLREVEP